MQPSSIMPSGWPRNQLERPRRRSILRGIWVLLSVLSLGIFLASIPDYLASLRMLCRPLACIPGQLTSVGAEELDRLGISLTQYATVFVTLAVVTGLLWCLMAMILFFRGPGNPMTLFTALMLVTFGLIRFPGAPVALAAAHPTWGIPVAALRFFGSACLSFFCYLFPSGKFVPKWTAPAAFLWLVPQVPEFFWPASPLDPNGYPAWLQAAGFLAFVASVVVAQSYRYWRVSSSAERQQTKWVIWGIAVALTGFLLLTFVLPVFLPGNVLLAASGPYVEAAASLVMLLLPISIGIAIQRSRLYDIDLLINRTIVYGLLTTVLTLTYVTGIFGLQSLVQVVDHSERQSPVVIVLSTLLIAALFQPLRGAIQSLIDRRFYRRKYDATRIMDDFTTSVQNEVDLSAISHSLLTVVEDTMHPMQASLWLRQPAGGKPAPPREEERTG